MMQLFKKMKRLTAILCAVLMLLTVVPANLATVSAAGDDPASHSGAHMLQAALKGESGNWAYVEQEVDGITANTDYTFGIWARGSGIVTLKIAAAGSTVSFTRLVATEEWSYYTVDFNSGTRSGKMTFSIVDSAATAFPQSQVAGSMYIDDAFFGAQSTGANLLQNPGFEASTDGWNKLLKDVFSVVEGIPETEPPEEPVEPEDPPVDTTVYTGTHSLKADLAGLPSLWAYLTQRVTGISAGTIYEFGMWVKGDGAATMKISKGSSSGSALKFVRQKATGDWVYWNAEYTAASNEDLYFSIYDSASVPGSGITQAEAQGTTYMDDAFFGVKGTAVNLLINSSFEATAGLAEWTVANNSAPPVFSVAEGIAENDDPQEPGDPTDPSDPTDPPSEPPTEPDNTPNMHTGNRSMEAKPKGKKSDWKTVTQQVSGITADTNYEFGAWIKGSGAVTIKAAKSNGDNIQFIRPKATSTWSYVSASFNSGTYSGTVIFSISDSAGNVLPEAEAAGTMYLDDLFFGIPVQTNLLTNSGFEEQLKYWGGDKGTVFTRYPNQSDNPPAQQYDGVNNLGVYSWDRNPDGVADFGEWIGRTPTLAEDFLEQNTWSDLEGGNRLAAWEDSPFAGSMLWAAYPFPKTGGSLAAAANGDYNDHYRQLGENLIAAGMANATIRFGHEFNGGWYIWSVGNANNPDHLQKCLDFAEAFRQFVTTLRSIEGQQFKFVWNPATAIWGVDLEAAFPGRDYVDFVGIDHYDQTWAQSGGSPIYGAGYANADPAEKLRRQQLAWTSQVNDGNWGLNMIAAFAADQGVPLGICEWGLATRPEDGMGGADNPYFIEKMHEWIDNNNVAWHVYFNVSASDGDHDLYDTVAFPQASAKFGELWNPNGAPDTSPAIEPSDIDGIGDTYVQIEGEDGVLSGSANKLHGDPWASGGRIALMYRSGNSLSFGNANKADDGIAIVYQGWQSDQKASLYVNNVLTKKNILFPQHGRSWSDSYGYVVIDDVQIPEGATVKLQINPDDVLDNFDSFKVDYILLLGATGEYVKPDGTGDGSGDEDWEEIQKPSRTSYTHSGNWALTANVKGTGDTNGSSYSAQPTLTAGVNYTFGAWIKGSGRMALVIQNTTSWAEVLVAPFEASADWKYVSATYTPTTTGKYNIKIGDRSSGSHTGRVYIDDASLAATDGSASLIAEDFEDGGAKWWHPANHFAAIDYSAPAGSSNAHSGSWAMKVTASPETAGLETLLSPAIPIAANQTYTFKLWAKGNADFSVRLLNANDQQSLAEHSFSSLSGQWEEKTFSFTAAASANAILKIVNESSEGALYLDDFLLHAEGRNNTLPNRDFELGKSNWEENAAFSIIDFNELILSEGLIDELGGLDSAEQTSNIRIDAANPAWYGGDIARAARVGTGDGYLVYDLNSDIKSVSVSLYADGGIAPSPLSVSVSQDGSEYQDLALTADTYANTAKSNLPLTIYESYDIPEGMTLLKITIPDNAVPDSVQISEIAINATAAPVTATPGSGEIEPGQFIALSTIEPDGEIYYKITGSQAKTLYQAPIKLDSSATLTAWTEKTGKKTSLTRTFSYINADEVIVDPYGQIRSAEFPGKINDDEEFAQASIDDEEFTAGLTAPGGRDSYGGLAGSKDVHGLRETGFFHIGKLDGKSVMVDPLGNLYFNLAVNGTGYVDETFTVVNGRESVYEWLPGKDGPFKTAYDGNGNFSFYVANLIRRTGQPFNQAQYSADSVDFVKSLGFTGLGAWSNASGMPDLSWLPMPSLKIGDTELFDIFHPDMLNQMDVKFSALANNANDTELIGYMFANELPYNKLKSAVPAANASSGSKVRLVEMLAAKYGTIAGFNAAWDLSFASFDALKNGSFAAKTELATRDMDDFTEIYLDELYKQIAYYTRKYDPNHLVIGDRWLANVMNDSKLREYLAEYAGKYLDVLTYNYYTYDLNLEVLERLYELAGETPFIMTEFHYGDPTTGLTFAARMAEGEHEKGLMYSNYVEKAAASGFIVGTNWFTFLDQAPTGRWFQGLNGEAGAIGLVNVAGRPYRDFLQSVSTTNAKIYDLILGNASPYQHEFKPGQVDRASDKVLDVTKAGAAPTIGDFDTEWADAVTQNITDVDLVLGLMQQGIGAQMSLTWDDENYYIRAHIDDPTPMQSPNVIKANTVPAAKAYLWAGDAVELFFGPNNVNDGGSMQYNDSQILLAAAVDDNGDTQTAFYWTGYREQEQPVIDMAARMDADGKGYTIDAKIAFADIGATAIGDGTVIRYDMGMDEGGAKGRERQFFWNGVDGNSTNREKWGKIVLTDDEQTDNGNTGDDSEDEEDGNNEEVDSPTDVNDVNNSNDGGNPTSDSIVIDANGKMIDALDYNEAANEYTAELTPVDGKAYLTISGKALGSLAASKPNSVIDIMTPFGGYGLPTNLAEITNGLSDLLVARKLTKDDISFKVTLTDASTDTAVNETVSRLYPSGKVFAGVSYTIEAIDNGTGETVATLSRFDDSIARSIRLPDATIDEQGKEIPFSLPEWFGVWKIDETSNDLIFVPHLVKEINGVKYLVIESLTNSTYVVAENHVEFADVAKGKWYTEAIEQAAAKKLVVGVGNGRFAPSKAITRAEFTQMVINMMQLPDADANTKAYSDVPATHFFSNAIMKAKSAGLLDRVTTSDGGKFKPTQPISREEMASILSAAAAYDHVAAPTASVALTSLFKDGGSIDENYADDVLLMYKLGFMQGVSSDSFGPKAVSTRAQAATVLIHAAKQFGLID